MMGASPTISVEEHLIPRRWKKNCMEGQKGGVFAVFINGKDVKEIKTKIKKIKKFIKEEV